MRVFTGWQSLAVVAAFAIFLLLPAKSWALSCMEPSMSQEIFDASTAVFTGRVIEERKPTEQDLKTLEDHGIKSFSGTMEEIRVYRVLVQQPWKGVESGSEVFVYRDTYWGDALSPDHEFLFVTGRKIGPLYEAELCGNTLPLSHATELLEVLKRIAP